MPPSRPRVVQPRARAAPMLCMLRNTMWMLGGQVEISHTDIVLGAWVQSWVGERRVLSACVRPAAPGLPANLEGHTQ